MTMVRRRTEVQKSQNHVITSGIWKSGPQKKPEIPFRPDVLPPSPSCSLILPYPFLSSSSSSLTALGSTLAMSITMPANLPTPILNISVDALKDLDGAEALTSLWFLFTKCQASLHEGKRLENLSWRLWSQQMTGRSFKYRPLTPDSPTELGPSASGSGPVRVFTGLAVVLTQTADRENFL
ncbi:hypothetical protein GYMLUDRAFT_914663 [Collybiopsis luxurians FD-317 M1]|nr:hypothetical protein GYMLUDRAFT_914663 [Collybiopsis luxurians FD-317 M1]